MMALGRYAEIAPHYFSEPPIVDFHEHALVFHVSLEQAAGLSLPPTMDTSEPVAQGRGFERLAHIVGKMADANMGLPATRRVPDGWERRLCALFALFSPDMPVADQIAAQTPPGVDLAGVAVLAVPVFKFGKKERVQIGHRLPFIPT